MAELLRYLLQVHRPLEARAAYWCLSVCNLVFLSHSPETGKEEIVGYLSPTLIRCLGYTV